MHARALRRSSALATALLVAAALLIALPAAPAAADPDPPADAFDYTDNMEPLGWVPRPTTSSYNSDLAFWGDTAYMGTYAGFVTIDISDPEDPQKLAEVTGCSSQGDMVVWDNILVRAYTSTAGGSTPPCGGDPVPSGWRGFHIFDVSNPADPQYVTKVNPGCVSHTATGVPDLANNRLLIYNNPSSTATNNVHGGSCGGFDIVEIPLDSPQDATVLRHISPSPNRSCHDITVMLEDTMLAVCAGGNGFAVFSLGGERGGSLEEPVQVHSESITGVSIGHTAAFTWDGKTFVFGHEPGGGTQARCQATSAEVDKTVWFYDSETFQELGRWVLPRPQTAQENCTIHNFNVVPHTSRNILVSGNYQAGISVVDFTDPANAYEFAYADPYPVSGSGGDWSSYWYNGIIYQSDMRRGMITWRLNDPRVEGHIEIPHLNPQTYDHTLQLPENPFALDLDPGFEVDGDTARISGTAEFPGGLQTVGGARTTFSEEVAPVAAAAGLELEGGTIEPIDGGLRFTWEVSDLPEQVPPEGVRYAWALRVVGGAVYELEAKRTNVASTNALDDPVGHVGQAASGEASFRLRGACGEYEGTPLQDCHHLAHLNGAFDDENDRVSIDWPFETRDRLGRVVAPDFTPHATIANCGACAATEGMSISASFQAVRVANDRNLSNFINGWSAYHARPRVQVAVGQEELNPVTLSYGAPVLVNDGAFTVTASGVTEAKNTVYVRACGGTGCAYASVRVK